MPENAHENSSRCAAATTRPTTTNASWRWLNVAPDLISKSVEKDPAKKQELPDNHWPPGDQILMRKWKSSRPVKKTKVRSHVSTFLSEAARDAVRFVPCVAATSYLVLLLSLYFNGPPPDETFRFHRLLQSVESVELPIDFSPSILEMESLNSYFIIKAADGRRPICQLPYLPAGISRWRFILVLECRLAFFFPYTEHSSQTLAVLSSVVSGNTTGGAEDGVSS